MILFQLVTIISCGRHIFLTRDINKGGGGVNSGLVWGRCPRPRALGHWAPCCNLVLGYGWLGMAHCTTQARGMEPQPSSPTFFVSIVGASRHGVGLNPLQIQSVGDHREATNKGLYGAIPGITCWPHPIAKTSAAALSPPPESTSPSAGQRRSL